MKNNVHIHIEKIILEDINLSMKQRQDLKAIIVNELTQLFAEGHPPSANTLSHMTIDVSPEQTAEPAHLGQHIAQSLHHHLGPDSV